MKGDFGVGVDCGGHLSSPRSSVAVFSGSSLRNRDLYMSVLVSSEEENG